MKPHFALRTFVGSLSLVLFSCSEPTSVPDASEPPAAQTVSGLLVLPPGAGARGIEVIASVHAPGVGEFDEWVWPDAEGRFVQRLGGTLTKIRVVSGIQAVVHGVDADELPGPDRDGRIDVGTLDLRDRVRAHRVTLLPAAGTPGGDVRVAMWFDDPPTPGVALGSKQFPERTLGDEVEWLVPRGEHGKVYFLIERPGDEGRGLAWRTGRQTEFGPFDGELPTELRVD